MTHASLFSGIGGPEVVAAMMGWKNIFHCEINTFGRQVLEYWFPNSDSYEDITKTDFTRYRGRIDILTGGFPCQPFSYAGKRGGQTDDRYLWPEMLRVIDEVRPTWVVGENVAGITTMVESCEITDMGGETSLFEEDGGVHRFRSEHTFTVERICRDLESKGYSVQPVLIPACAVGAPHRRDRVFIIAHNADCGHDVRKPGESDNVRSKVHGFIEDSVCDGCWSGQKAEQRNQRDIGYTGPRDSERVCREARVDSSDTYCCRQSASESKDQSSGQKNPSQSKGFSLPGSVGYGAFRSTTDSDCDRGGESIARMLSGERWKWFPTVSPVHRGNDGLPFDVDNLTISFAKWRNESLKAYGNAIVPQVMYRIFQCIEAIENDK